MTTHDLIRQAIQTEHSLGFTYTAASGEVSQRIVEPVRMVPGQKSLQAFCFDRVEYRHFTKDSA